jgi:hypothetical protein
MCGEKVVVFGPEAIICIINVNGFVYIVPIGSAQLKFKVV